MKYLLLLFCVMLITTSAQAQSTVTANIHNAAGWEPRTSYTYNSGPPNGHFMRINGGPGWTPSGGTSGTWNAGLTLYNYQLDASSSPFCTSGASAPTWIAGTVHDNTCIWDYVGLTDYITITGWGLDNGKVWTTGTTYGFLDVVHTTDTNLPVFQQEASGCVSTIKPTTSNINTFLSDGCYWMGNLPDFGSTSQQFIYYTSNANTFPMSESDWDTFQGTISGTTLTVSSPPATYALAVGQIITYPGMANPTNGFRSGGQTIVSGSGTSWQVSPGDSVSGTFFVVNQANGVFGTSTQFNVAQVWNDREYVSGTNGESSPIIFWNHNYRYNDSLLGFNAATFNPTTNMTAAGYTQYGYPFVLKAASGESFEDTLAANSGLALAGYNANYGVGLRGVGAAGLAPADSAEQISGLQITSNTSVALDTGAARAGNYTVVDHDILEGGTGAEEAVSTGAAQVFNNDLIVAQGALGLEMDYGGNLSNNTIVCPAGTCTSAIDMTIAWINEHGLTIQGNLVFGFTHFTSSNFYNNQDDWHTCTWWCVGLQGTNNGTDVASTDGVGWDSCAWTLPTPTPCPPYTFTAFGSFQSWAIPFKTGYTYTSSGQPGSVANLCAATWGRPGQFYPQNPGTCRISNSLSPSSVFVSWPGNYKIASTSPAYGAGASFSAMPIQFCIATSFGCSWNANTPDVIGTARPQGGRFDVGAFEIPGVTSLPGRRLFR